MRVVDTNIIGIYWLYCQVLPSGATPRASEKRMSQVWKLTRSGYYARRRRPEIAHAEQDRELLASHCKLTLL